MMVMCCWECMAESCREGGDDDDDDDDDDEDVHISDFGAVLDRTVGCVSAVVKSISRSVELALWIALNMRSGLEIDWRAVGSE